MPHENGTYEGKTGLGLLTHYAEADNIAEYLEGERLLEIGNDVIEGYDEDELSRAEWLKENEKAIECARQIVKEKSWPWPNAANVKYPLVTSAAIHFNSRAMPAIVSGNQVVKGQVIGADPTGEKEARAERIGQHMSYQLLEEMEGWEEETDQLLTILPITGNVFRKTFYCPLEKKNISKLVRAENFVFSNDSTFSTAPRYTEILPDIYMQDVIERQRLGIWLDEDFGLDAEEEDEPQEFLEQHCLLDLDEDGYKEPYIVTVHKESKKVVRVVARYDIGEVTVRYNGELGKVKEFEKRQSQEVMQRVLAIEMFQAEGAAMMARGEMPPPMPAMPAPFEFDISKAEIVRISPVQYYTKYGFIPAFDGGGYDIGLGALLGPIGETINTNLNQMLDAGTLSNLQGGFISKGLRVRKGALRVSPNEWNTVENTTGGSIRDSIVPFNFPGPSQTLFALLQFLLEAAKDISSIKDATTGEMAGANESPTTYLTRVSEGLKVFSAIYKRIHRSLKQELRKLYRLNRLYLTPEEYANVLDSPQVIQHQDYEGEGVDVVPVSDPTIATTTQKNAKAAAIYQTGKGNPFYNQYEVEKRFLESMEVEGIDKILLQEPPPPPPDPRLAETQAKIEKIAAEIEKIKAETINKYNDMQIQDENMKKEFSKEVLEFRKFIEELDFKRIAKRIDLLAKIVPERENLETYRQAKGEMIG